MRKKMELMSVVFAAVVIGCSSENDEQRVEKSVTDEQRVVVTFMPYDVSPMTRGDGGPVGEATGTVAMTRTATSIASIVTHLDVWLVSGGDVIALQQTKDDAGFGSISVTLDNTKTYTLYAVGHKADGATMADGVIAFTDDKVTHSMYYTTTFSPATTTSIDAEMTRIVGNFRVEITDAVPDEVTRMAIHIGESPTRWNVTTGGCNPVDRSATYNIGTKTGVILSTFVIAQDDAATDYMMTVTAYDANDDVVQERTFADVPIRNGYRTTYRGAFFTDAVFTTSFTVNDWNDYETVDF